MLLKRKNGLHALRKEDLTRKFILASGSRWVETIEINPNDVYIPLGKEGIARNAVRTKLDDQHILALTGSFQNEIDPSQPVPIVVKYETPKIFNGKVYLYELVCGFHRQYAILNCGFESYVYDLYEFGVDGVPYTRAIRTLQLVENDGLPKKNSQASEIENVIMELIERKELGNNESDIRAYLDEVAAHKHHATKTSIVKRVLNNTGGYRDVTTYNFDQVEAYLLNLGNYQSSSNEYKVKFEYDVARGKRGASILESYEIELIPQAMKYFAKDGSETYFNMHVKAPSAGKSVDDSRYKMLESIRKVEESILVTADFYKKHGRFPWTLENWLPQDNKNGETSFIPVDDYLDKRKVA
jgi:hypothetical protein